MSFGCASSLPKSTTFEGQSPYTSYPDSNGPTVRDNGVSLSNDASALASDATMVAKQSAEQLAEQATDKGKNAAKAILRGIAAWSCGATGGVLYRNNGALRCVHNIVRCDSTIQGSDMRTMCYR